MKLFNRDKRFEISDKEKVVFCSIVTANYLGQVASLNESLRNVGHMEPHYVLLVDYTKEILNMNDLRLESFNFVTIHISELSISRFNALLKKYSPLELANILKPYFMEWLLKKLPQRILLAYLDSDTFVLSRMNPIFETFSKGDKSVLLTPHLSNTKLYFKSKDYRLESSFFSYGLYNGGFYLLKNDKNSSRFLNWQRKIITSYGFAKVEEHMYVDQKILDLAPILFDFIMIFKDPAYNVGHWNLGNGDLKYSKGRYTFLGRNLVFFHFSQLQLNENKPKNSILCNIEIKKDKTLYRLFEVYYKALVKNKHFSYKIIPYGYIK